MRPRTSAGTWRALAASLLVFTLVSCGADDPSTPSSGSSTTQSSAGSTTPSDRDSVDATGEDTGSFPWTGDPKRDGSLRAVRIRAREVAHFEQPTILVRRPNDDRLYVGERAGRIHMLEPDGNNLEVTGPTVLDISRDVTTEAERGLLGLAFSADGSVL